MVDYKCRRWRWGEISEENFPQSSDSGGRGQGDDDGKGQTPGSYKLNISCVTRIIQIGGNRSL